MPTAIPEPIAIVGIGCRLPGGITSTKTFWEVLQRGMNMVTEVPEDRFDSGSFYDPDARKQGTIRSPKGGFVPDIKAFDAEFFGYFPTEAERIDPQQRLALEASYHALEDSGTTLEQVTGSCTGVFMGTFFYDHLAIQTSADQRDYISPHTAMGVANCSIANRISHRLNLQGPSVTLDTACSSSLVAVHLACQSIWAHESDGALAGGVNVILRPESTILMSKGGFLSPDGACKPFDAAANGFVRSEGVGVVFLKPFSRALQDRDRIYAVIRGSLVNQDGNTPEGYTVPSLEAQSRLIQSVYSRAGIDPAKVQYVEAHGPGTPVGDPIETKALGAQIGQKRSAYGSPMWIGSVKGNVGHLEGASGITGLIKATLAVFHGQIPPQVNHKTPNPVIDFKSLNLAVPLKLTPMLSTPDHEIIVGLNSFGAGGTNAHAILAAAPTADPSPMQTRGARVVLLSARSQAAMQDIAKNLAVCIRQFALSLEDVAYTMNLRRSCHRQVAIIPATESEELCARLDQLGANERSKDVLVFGKQLEANPKVAFLFSGQGGQWLKMGMRLAEEEPIFRESIDTFDKIFLPLAGFSILEKISGKDSSELDSTVVVQPAIAAIEIALARMIIAYGIQPDAIVGHSIGEVAAAHISGALSLEDTVATIYLRSSIQSKAAGMGSMLAVGLSSSEAQQLIDRHQMGAKVEIATLNGLKMTTLTGNTYDLELISLKVKESGAFAQFVKVDVPYHSAAMDSLEEEVLNSLSTINGNPTKIDLYSTVTTRQEPGIHLTGEYWFKNIRQPVRYVETVTRMLEDGCNFLIEVGPHPVLVSGTRGIAESLKVSAQILPAMIRESDTEPMSRLLGAAHAFGIPVDLLSFNGHGGQFIDLPLYPFQRENYWFETPTSQYRRLAKSRHPFYGESTALLDDGRVSIQLRLNTGVSPFLADHVVDGAIVFPMAGHIEAAYMAAAKHMSGMNVWLEDLQFENPVVLAPAEDFAPQVLLEIISPAKDYMIGVRGAASTPETSWQLCSRGKINAFDQRSNSTPEVLEELRLRVQMGTQIDVQEFYEKLERAGLRYGEAFRGNKEIWRLGGEVFTRVELPQIFHAETKRFRFHPAMLDACLHAAFVDIHHHGDCNVVYLPHHIEKAKISHTDGATTAFTHIKVRHRDNNQFCYDATIYNENGQLLASVVGLTAKRVGNSGLVEYDEHEITIMPESEDEKSDRVPIDFTNILFLDLQFQSTDDLMPLVKKTFISASIHQADMATVDSTWAETGMGFPLDRRSLIIIPTVAKSTLDICQKVDIIFTALRRVASWIHEQGGTPTVIIFTTGGCMTPTDLRCDPVSSCIEAAVRVMVNELPRSRIRVVDLPMEQEDMNISLLEEELRTNRLSRHDTLVAIRSAGRFFKQITPVSHKKQRQKTTLLPARGGAYFCEPDASGSIDRLSFQRIAEQSLAPFDISIEVHASGLNFKDVMNSMGLLTERSTSRALGGRKLGLEVAGRVVQVGKDVQDMTVGTWVMARVAHGLAGLVVADRKRVLRIPKSLTVAEASCIPVAYLTAYYALVHLGRLNAGDSVLIHSAAGGVGIAAIYVAKLFGARIFATAGNPQRREIVSNMGVETVWDSRSLTFHDQLKEATGGRGVDLVLNSLTGNMFTQSLSCLAPFGRFLEIGKTDIYRNMRIGLQQFGENCSFFVVDIDRLAVQKPDLHNRLFEEIGELFDQGKLSPLPVTSYPISKLPTALKSLSRSAIIGKVAVEMPVNENIPIEPAKILSLRGDRTYLITGGASGLGLHLAQFLFDRGAQYLLLVSRSGAKSPEDLAIISELRRQGAVIIIRQADVSKAAAIAELCNTSTDWPSIAGIIHSAGVLNDAYAQETSKDDFWKVFAPKAIGAWNLHLATEKLALDFFVMISSVSSVVGLTGQFSYATANKFLDALASHRKSLGLPGLSLNLGVLGSFAGMSHRSEQTDRIYDVLQSQGFSSVNLPTVLSVLERTILQNATQRMVSGADFSLFVKAHPHLSRDGLFSDIQRTPDRPKGINSRRTAENLSSPSGLDYIGELLRSGLAKIMGIESSRISLTERIDKYAFDSLTLTQMRGMILREFRVAYPLMRLFQGPCLEDVAVEVQSSLEGDPSKVETTNFVTQIDAEVNASLTTEFSVLSPWFIRGKGYGSRVVCFHPMGTGASFYAPFLANPPDALDPVAVQLPGRENRLEEAAAGNVQEIVSAILADMNTWKTPPRIFWGHSFGGIIAFEVMRALRREGKSMPYLMVTGSIAPQLISIWQRRDVILQLLTDNSSPEYLLGLSRYVDDGNFIRSLLPMMKQDAPLLLSYQFQAADMFDVPITAFAAHQDDLVYPDEIACWGVHSNDFKFIEVDGDHWFIRRNFELLMQTLKDMIAVQNGACS
ncbi:hypothetical protein N7520_010844 [Penicillium odoratum]|uniref:uncharacterized protein n=1 Tax=Penicillium odoratum TaxID=1167516 RepID=UPI00254786BE|nr:uncharacterized protein N7520_010844 [Penicillium odoratum]KAJ5745662.1 hypothetical protein N7520_010844 [Penicillium odoratum]